jgi:hypothetical protein
VGGWFSRHCGRKKKTALVLYWGREELGTASHGKLPSTPTVFESPRCRTKLWSIAPFLLENPPIFFPEPPEHYRVEADLFVSKVLKHQYTYSSSNLMCFYGERTDRLTQMELLMLPLEHRPGNFLELLAKYGSLWLRSSLGFTRPPSWRYYDDQIPAWYQAYVEQQEEGVM